MVAFIIYWAAIIACCIAWGRFLSIWFSVFIFLVKKTEIFGLFKRSSNVIAIIALAIVLLVYTQNLGFRYLNFTSKSNLYNFSFF